MKKTVRMMGLCALMMLAIVSCKKENKTVTFEAKMPETTTMGKTHLGADNYLVWNSGDQIKVYTDELTDETAVVFSTMSDNSRTATFSGTLAESSNYMPFYPAEGVIRSGNNILYPMPANQNYVDGDFAVNTYPMYATSTGTTFNFTSLCGLLKLSFTGTGTIGSVVLSDNYYECIAGQYEYNVNTGSYGLFFTEPAITMDCGAQGLTLSDTPVTMYFVVPSGYFTHGFTAVLKNLQGEEMYTLSTSQNNEITAQVIREMPTLNIAAVSVTTGTATPNADTPSTVTLSGSYSVPTGMSVSEVGFYWGQGADLTNRQTATLENPFSYTLNLAEGQTYSYQAYAVNGNNEVLGSVETFTTLTSIPDGAINGKFTINANGDQVYFSQGNLQFQASSNTWRFAENQWDYVGTQIPDDWGDYGGTVSGSDNVYISSTYDGWIDLFGWGTSGYHYSGDPNNTNYQPWSISTSNVNMNYNHYGYGPSTNMTSPNLTGNSSEYDWGVHNAISNGGNQVNLWRTLTKDQWEYVINTRNTNSGIRYAKAKVNGVNGAILLSDGWSISYYALSNTNSIRASFDSNIITTSQWNILEQHGAVFLPAAGSRIETTIQHAGSYGSYSTASYGSEDNAYSMFFHNVLFGANYSALRFLGESVRLVRDVE